MVPTYAMAQMPPLMTAPGHTEGEKRKEEAADTRHPIAKPMFGDVRSAAGWPKKMSAAAKAMEMVAQETAPKETAGVTDAIIEPITVKVARTVPATRVLVISPTLAINVDVEV